MGDHLSMSVSSLSDLDKQNDVILMCELFEETTYVKHHRQKLVFILSAMRHFARDLRQQGIQVDYVKLDDPDNTGNFTAEIGRAIQRHNSQRVIVTHPGEWRVLQQVHQWQHRYAISVEIRDDDRFLSSIEDFARWSQGRKTLRMEFFYRELRRKTGWLMLDGEPEGGQWNYDVNNRKALPRDTRLPARTCFIADEMTREVQQLVKDRFKDHFGNLDGFAWAVTRQQALQALEHFISDCLPNFGAYQDAMKTDGHLLFHALLSPYLNVGLLLPREVCAAALSAYALEQASLSSVEGFIRQILGWREFIHGIYWVNMPDYADSNFLQANRPLPAFFWTTETPMFCLQQCLQATYQHAYAHHIQRLMVIGNFALLAGLNPAEVEAWYLAVFTDAFEWVELPNTHGMVLHADNGLLGSKPYAASGAYINRMSDYCKNCVYDVKKKQGEQACPFNYLYWDFIMRNAEHFQQNPRMAMPYHNLAKKTAEEREQITKDATKYLQQL